MAHFLDGFVADHNSTGHAGRFLNDRTLKELRDSGWRILSVRERRFCWEFANRDELGDFAWNLFDLCKTTASAAADAIERELGVITLPGGRVGMNWSLMTIRCRAT